MNMYDDSKEGSATVGSAAAPINYGISLRCVFRPSHEKVRSLRHSNQQFRFGGDEASIPTLFKCFVSSHIETEPQLIGGKRTEKARSSVLTENQVANRCVEQYIK